jgi:hypothetical protein
VDWINLVQVETSGRNLVKRKSTFWFHKALRITCIAEDLLASQKKLIKNKKKKEFAPWSSLVRALSVKE